MANTHRTIRARTARPLGAHLAALLGLALLGAGCSGGATPDGGGLDATSPADASEGGVLADAPPGTDAPPGADARSSGGDGGDGGAVAYTCAATLDVATSGDDANAGTAAQPLRSIHAAAMRATAGTCIRVHAGRYLETQTIRFMADGTAAAPIVLQSVDGLLAAVIDDSGNTDAEGLYIDHDHIVVDGFDFVGMTGATQQQTLHLDGRLMGHAAGTIVRHCRLTGGYDILKINQIAGDRTNAADTVILFEQNEFFGTPPHLPLSITSGFNVVFRANHFHDFWSAANVSGDGAIQVKGGSSHVVFDGNLFENVFTAAGTIAFGDGCASSCDVDPDHYASVANVARNNVMVHVGRAFDFGGARDCAALNNTIVNTTAGNVVFKLTPAVSGTTTRDSLNVRILNNIIAGDTADASDVIQINGNSGVGLQMGHNLYFRRGAPAAMETGSISGDPRFANSGAGDFRVLAGSPAIGAGTNLFADVPVDYRGAARPTSGAFTIGAFEGP
jgi:hypothetical protein